VRIRRSAPTICARGQWLAVALRPLERPVGPRPGIFGVLEIGEGRDPPEGPANPAPGFLQRVVARFNGPRARHLDEHRVGLCVALARGQIASPGRLGDHAM
jgi:hypothetical protein